MVLYAPTVAGADKGRLRETCKPPGAAQERAMSGGTEGTFHALANETQHSFIAPFTANVINLQRPCL